MPRQTLTGRPYDVIHDCDTRTWPTKDASDPAYCWDGQELKLQHLMLDDFIRHKNKACKWMKSNKRKADPYGKAIFESATKTLNLVQQTWMDEFTLETLDGVGPEPLDVWQYLALACDLMGMHRGAEIVMSAMYVVKVIEAR